MKNRFTEGSQPLLKEHEDGMSAIDKRTSIVLIFMVISMLSVLVYNLDGKKVNRFKLLLEDPIVVAQGKSYKALKWGPYQFPKLGFTLNGDIYCKFANKPDSIKHYEGNNLSYISTDFGKTWKETTQEIIKSDILMSNGCYFQEISAKNAYESEKIKALKPIEQSFEKESRRFRLFRADRVKTIYDNKFKCIEYDPKRGVLREFESKISWPYMPLVERNGLVIPTSALARTSQIFKVDKDLYMALYSYGFDSITGKSTGLTSNIYLFKSKDSARNWQFISQIIADKTDLPDGSFGLYEPFVLQIPNGNFMIILRTGNGLPSLFAISKDKGVHWSKLLKFADVGVCPQALVLPSGVTLVSYGRPGIYIKASGDKDCIKWQEPLKLDVGGNTVEDSWSNSCCYTSLLPLGNDEVMIAYSNFKYNGEEKKTILVQKIKVKN